MYLNVGIAVEAVRARVVRIVGVLPPKQHKGG